MSRRYAAVGIVMGAIVLASPALGAQAARAGATGTLQTAPGPNRVEVVIGNDDNADQVRQRLQRVLQQYPTTLAEVLRRDPSLLHNDAYLAPYPALAAFLNQHPSIGHNPAYFLGNPQRDSYSDPGSQKVNAVRDIFQGFTVLAGVVSLFTMLGFVTKSLIDHRRWSRVTKVQTEAHAKVMDRLTSSDDLLAYIQSPAGQRYLGSAPFSPAAPAEGPVSAPYSRILWSVQAGVVASLVGVGFLFVSSRWTSDPDWSGEASRMLFLFGVLLLAAGVGLVLSGVTSFALSRRFGLIQPTASKHA